MRIKQIILSNPATRRMAKKTKFSLKYRKDFNYDYRHFKKHYSDNEQTPEQIEYKVLLLEHNLEKGMCFKVIRPFGQEKVVEMIRLLNRLEQFSNTDSTAFTSGVDILRQWLKISNSKEWPETQAKKQVELFLDAHTKNTDMHTGSFANKKSEMVADKKSDFLSVIQTRHSARDYLNKELSKKDIEYCLSAASHAPSACNRQMIKFYFVDTPAKKKALEKVILGLHGFNLETVNLFLVTYDASFFSYGGERNQGYFNAGLATMNFCNAAHVKGIGTCFLQWSNTVKEEIAIKKVLGIPESERIAVTIGAGYYVDESRTPCSQRKKIDEFYKKI